MSSNMPYYSPLRYPGGKRRLTSFIASVCQVNEIDGHYVEAYAGGAAVGLELLLTDRVREITINDLDRSVYAFWKSIMMYPEELCSMIRHTRVNVKNWNMARAVQKNKQHAKILELGFSTFFLNRTNYSGIINGGILGGKEQQGEDSIDCRFNKHELVERIARIAEYKKHIHVHNYDAINLIKALADGPDRRNTLYYFDPPYYTKGAYLYMNHYGDEDHGQVAKAIQGIRQARWIVSYDNVRRIREYYSKYRYETYSLYHTARSSRIGKEILFFSDNLDKLDDAVMKIPSGSMSRCRVPVKGIFNTKIQNQRGGKTS